MSRYDGTPIINNSFFQYSNLLARKKLNFIKQYTTFDFNKLKNFKEYDLDVVYHIVKPFDRMYNISNTYYNSPEYSWLICYTNKLSSEFDMTIGMSLTIYFPLNTLLGLLE